ncbi:DnaB-like helicase N-terminal domain-containing protein [Nesterenkonia sp. K-15-9-6]|uniref:DnaB-like helicase N-terminal domain-containing protein n=1 Tax=Nesterenkonia sp. K-15-9-6 TaxID=3093918 RepID=UPI00404495DA
MTQPPPDHVPDPMEDQEDRAIISTLLMEGAPAVETFQYVDLGPADFTDWRHRLIVLAAFDLHAAGEPINVMSIGGALFDQGALVPMGEYEYLHELAMDYYTDPERSTDDGT